MRPIIFSLLALAISIGGGVQLAAGDFSQPDSKAYPNLYQWTDTCNVWVLKEGDAALLIDLGDGSVLDALPKLGVKHVEWVLFTHHHREQCQGAPRLAGTEAKLAAPTAEKALFETPANFRKMKVTLQDQFTVYGSSFVRPPIQPIKLDRTFEKTDSFAWRGHEFWCVDTRGSSPGSMSYLLRTKDGWVAFTGDLMLDGANKSFNRITIDGDTSTNDCCMLIATGKADLPDIADRVDALRSRP